MLIPYSRQNINFGDEEAVLSALRSEFLTQGPRVSDFESQLASSVDAKFAIAVNSATSALHLACLALEVGPGDTVWTSSISFVASANAARYCGAQVDFIDIEIDSFNLSVEHLRNKLESHSRNGRELPKVLIAVHMAGQPCDMPKIRELSLEYGFKVIEDASHALGSSIGGNKTGSCAYSDITVFSFHPVKMITTGEGGACLTNSPELANKIQRLRSHGITRDPNEMQSEYPGPWYYEQLDLGYNYRMTDFQAALGSSQLTRLESFVDERNRVAKWYENNLDTDSLILPVVGREKISSFHLYIVRFKDSKRRKAQFERMRSEGILVNVHYIPIYRHPYYAETGRYNPTDFANSEQYYLSCMSIPIFPGITEQDLRFVASSLSTDNGYQTIF
jgi:UDP-4-amino-4,6-dideoxy-N-acetyl-beta-L-altrosamine transaminase